MARYVLRVRRGGPWDFSLDMRQQEGWDEHAAFMDAVFDEGFVLMAGPLEGDRETVWLVEAQSEPEVRARLAEDPWVANRMLTPTSIERWNLVYDALKRAED